MTLDEAIKHCEDVEEEKRKDYERACAYNIPSEGCLECAEEHRQLAEWLEELKQLREQTRWIPVSDRLPEPINHREYLVTVAHYDPTYKGRFTMLDEYEARDETVAPYWGKNREKDGTRAVAWMPLPEPYKAESEG